jgi:hypothetical protein
VKADVAVMAARQAGKPAINNVTTLTLQQAAAEARVSVETLRGWCIRDTSLDAKKELQNGVYSRVCQLRSPGRGDMVLGMTSRCNTLAPCVPQSSNIVDGSPKRDKDRHTVSMARTPVNRQTIHTSPASVARFCRSLTYNRRIQIRFRVAS